MLSNIDNQSTKIKETINSFLDQGLTDKQVIYNKVVDELGVPRPTVRRVARDLRNELVERIRALQSALPPEEASGAQIPDASSQSGDDKD